MNAIARSNGRNLQNDISIIHTTSSYSAL